MLKCHLFEHVEIAFRKIIRVSTNRTLTLSYMYVIKKQWLLFKKLYYSCWKN